MSRMRALPKLIEIIKDECGVTTEMIERVPNVECIILRDLDANGKKIDIQYSDTPETIRMRKELRAYNNVLRANVISIPRYLETGIKIKVKRKGKPTVERRVWLSDWDKFVRRVFVNASFEDGGRYYGGWWQYIPKNIREQIRINDVPVIEIDYSGLHIVLLYAKKKIDYWTDIGEDPYELPHLTGDENVRDFLKLLPLTLINVKDKKTAIAATRMQVNLDPRFKWFKEAEYEIEELIDAFVEKHDPISSYFYNPIGVKLQNLDSQIAERVIKSFTDEDLPILCIHDSFIVQNYLEERLREEMDKAIAGVMGDDIDAKMKEKIEEEKYRWGNWMWDGKSLSAQRLMESGDKKYDEKVKDSEVINTPEEYYREIE